MNDFMILFFILASIFYISVYCKLISMGLDKVRTIFRTFLFPFKIFKLHLSLFKKYKNETLKERLDLLFFPIFHLPEAIINYGEMYLKKEAVFEALIEVLNELSNQEQEVLIEKLVDQGFLVKMKDTEIFSEQSHHRDYQEPIYFKDNAYSITKKDSSLFQSLTN